MYECEIAIKQKKKSFNSESKNMVLFFFCYNINYSKLNVKTKSENYNKK